MQTFLPYSDFDVSASVLDGRRLQNQRNECSVILKTACGLSLAWRHHPAVKMWVSYTNALCAYALAICRECDRRGIADNNGKHAQFLAAWEELGGENARVLPPWLGLPDFHLSHQSNLIRKDPEFYGPLFPGVSGTLEYVWPSKLRP